MEKEQHRSVIRFLHLEGKAYEEIKDRLVADYEDHAPSMTTIRYWFNEFKRGRTSVFDEGRSGRPKEVTTEDMVIKIHDIVLADRRVKIKKIAEMVDMPYERVHNILHQHLKMKKLSTRWVPRLLTVDQKRNRVTTSKECLHLFKANTNQFLRRFVTVDETWIHHYTPETKEQSKQWTSPGERAPKKAKAVPSAGKVMDTVFWYSQGIILIDYLENGKTITGQYNSELLDRFDAAFKEKRTLPYRKKLLFHHDNAPAHSSAVATEKLVELGYELLPHPPYLPDLVPCDFISYFLQGIKKLEYRWAKCIQLKGDYVKK
ncbi:histone-lysine N-methyltransferase SETMAR-like [Coccinella septempunctata]|uniref:histone-lysine N-methyltransferase SETMAR-like n=1 Tax=Coccinella septempunctata TaxID=41139 RepID=UPI001D066F96|nr:histone-lysine N-methyltransferase SETMAR-like [Coccinella septempunctata]